VPRLLERVTVVEGDVTLDRLGIGTGDFERLASETTHIIHCAAAVRFDLARLLMQRELWAEAEAELLAALDAVPTYAEATLELATLRRLAGRQDEAVAILVDLLQRDPYSFDALIALGEALIELGRKHDAATAFHRVLTFDPDHVGGIFYDAVMLASQRRFRDAIARWQRVVDLEPAGDFARRARRESRTAADLLKVFGDRLGGD